MPRKEEIKKGYKVVRRSYIGTLYSSWINTGIIHYLLNEWVKPLPKHGPLAVFETFEDAWNYREMVIMGAAAIYECEYVESKCRTIWFYASKRIYYIMRQLPLGTRFAKRVKLTKQVSL